MEEKLLAEPTAAIGKPMRSSCACPTETCWEATEFARLCSADDKIGAGVDPVSGQPTAVWVERTEAGYIVLGGKPSRVIRGYVCVASGAER